MRALSMHRCLVVLRVRVLMMGAAITLAILLAPRASAGSDIDSRVRPGARFIIEFPQFGKMQHDRARDGCVEIYIPTDWTPDKKIGLLCWFGGGEGTHSAETPKGISDGRSYVCAGLPYRPDIEGSKVSWRAQSCGWGTNWRYYKPILAEIERIVPNIDPRRRVVMGFSSGGAAIGTLMDETQEFTDYFYAFGVAGYAWWHMSSAHLKGRPVLLYGGENDGRMNSRDSDVAKYKSCGAEPEVIVYKGQGHVVDHTYFPKMRDWLDRKVTYRGLPEAMARMQAGVRAKRWTEALTAVRSVLGIADKGMKERIEAQSALEMIALEGDAELERMLGKSPKAKVVAEFAELWLPCPCAARARTKADELARPDLEGLAKMSSALRGTRLKRFIEEWNGYPVCDAALVLYEEDAAKAFAVVEKQRPSSSRLQAFIKKWSPAPSAERALVSLDALAKEKLDQAMAVTSASSRKSKLKSLIREFAGTDSAAAAEKALQEMHNADAAKVLEKIKAQSGSQRKMLLTAFLKSYGDTPSADEATKLLDEVSPRR